MRRTRQNYQRGGLMLGLLIVIAVISVLLIAYLSMVGQRARAVVRSQGWNLAVPVAEAGIEEAMAHLNHTKGRNMMTNGWLPVPTSTFVKSYPIADGRYVVQISNSSPPVVETFGSVESRGAVKVYSTTGEVERVIRVTTRFRPEIRGITAQNTALVKDLSRADSYDSNVGPYNPLTAGDNTFIGNNSTFAGQLEVSGSAKIYGDVGTGAPGGLKTPIPVPAVIGGAAYVNNPANGGTYESGHYSTSLNVPISTVPASPFAGGFAPTSGTWGTPATNYTYLLGNGNYKVFGSLTLQGIGVTAQKMMVTGNAALWVTDTLTVKGDAKIIIALNARLTLYIGNQFYAQENCQINFGGRPEQLAYYGLTSSAEFYMSHFAKVAAVVYTPQAKMDITGDAQFYGGGMCKDLVLGGNAQFHYDEALSTTKDQPFTITSWKEL